MFKIPNFKQNRGEIFILSPSRNTRYASPAPASHDTSRGGGRDTIQLCKTKPIYSLCVLRDAYCERNLKKQSQFENTQMNVNSVKTMNYEQITMNNKTKNKPNQSQFAGLWPEALSTPSGVPRTKSEILNKLSVCQ